MIRPSGYLENIDLILDKRETILNDIIKTLIYSNFPCTVGYQIKKVKAEDRTIIDYYKKLRADPQNRGTLMCDRANTIIDFYQRPHAGNVAIVKQSDGKVVVLPVDFTYLEFYIRPDARYPKFREYGFDISSIVKVYDSIDDVDKIDTFIF